MQFDATSLLLSFLIGGVGFVLLVYGKRMSRVPHIVVGILMMVYPYFVSSVILSLTIFAALLGGFFFAVKKLGV